MAEGSINRTLRVLTALCEHGPQTLLELSERVELSPPTTLRFLRIMRDEGFSEQDANRLWRPTLATWRLGCAVLDGTGWQDAVDDALRVAGAELDETVLYAAYESGWSIYTTTVEPRRDVRTHVPLGSRFPLPDTITGRCMMAYLPEEEVERVMTEHWGERWTPAERAKLAKKLDAIRAQGYAAGEGRRWTGLWALAVPVFGRAEEVLGAIATVVPVGRHPEDPAPVAAILQRATDTVSVRSRART